MEPLYKHIALLAQSYKNCMDNGDTKHAEIHADAILDIIKEHMPSGSGINAGTEFDWRSTGEKLIFRFEYHRIMNGRYSSVTIHNVFVDPSLLYNINIRITGFGNKEVDLADYCYQTFRDALLAKF